MKATLNKDKTVLLVEIPYNASDNAPKSATGKSVTRASTRGNMAVALDGKQVMLGINCYELVKAS